MDQRLGGLGMGGLMDAPLIAAVIGVIGLATVTLGTAIASSILTALVATAQLRTEIAWIRASLDRLMDECSRRAADCRQYQARTDRRRHDGRPSS